MHALSRRSISAALRSAAFTTRLRSSSTTAAVSSPPILSGQRDVKQFGHRDQIQQLVRSYSQIALFPISNWQVEDFNDTAEAIKEKTSGVLREVADAQIPNRVSFLPSVLETGMFGLSANMERLIKAQTVGDDSSQQIKRGSLLLLISPDNAIFTKLNAALPVDTSALGVVDFQYNAASLFGSVPLGNLALMGGMILMWRHIYTGIHEIMLDYVHNKNSRTFIEILLHCYILIAMKDAVMLLIS